MADLKRFEAEQDAKGVSGEQGEFAAAMSAFAV